MRYSTRTERLREFEAKIARLPNVVREAMLKTLERSTDEAVALIKRNAPVNPKTAPHIRDTVRKQRGRTDLTIDVLVGGESAPYAAPLEFGHMAQGTHVPGQPFFFPAIKVVRKRHRGRMQRAIRKAVRDLSGGGA